MADYFTEREKAEAEYAATNTVRADYISRQVAIDTIHQYSHFDDFDVSVVDEDLAVIALKNLPSEDAKPESTIGQLNTDAQSTKMDLISRQAAIAILDRWLSVKGYSEGEINVMRCMRYELEDMPSADAVEVVRCKDCLFGHRYFDVQNGETDSWVECRNPDGLNRDVSEDGYCCASIERG